MSAVYLCFAADIRTLLSRSLSLTTAINHLIPEMPETRNEFMLLAVHTDREFTHWLQRHAEDGWWLKENKGNTFVFIKRSYAGKRICSYTLTSSVLGLSAEDMFYDEQDDLRKKGWKLLVMGMPEKFTDKVRHAFLVESPREDLPHPDIPLADPEGQKALLRAARNKALSTIALCLIYAAVLIYFSVFRPDLLFTGTLGTFFLILTAVVLLPCLYYSVRAAALYTKAVRDPETDTTAADFQSLDRAVILSSVILGILTLYLILDLLL